MRFGECVGVVFMMVPRCDIPSPPRRVLFAALAWWNPDAARRRARGVWWSLRAAHPRRAPSQSTARHSNPTRDTWGQTGSPLARIEASSSSQDTVEREHLQAERSAPQQATRGAAGHWEKGARWLLR